MKITPESNCPLAGFTPCKQLQCAWFTQVRGVNPNTGDDVDEWGCAVAWLPVLLVENAQQSRHTGAAVESFRNVVAAGNEQTALMLAEAARQTQGRIAI